MIIKKEHAEKAYLVASIAAIIVLAYLLIKKDNQTCSPYTGGLYKTSGSNNTQKRICSTRCLCTGFSKVCADSCKLEDSYLAGNTEYQDFSKIQNAASGRPFWKSTNFSDY